MTKPCIHIVDYGVGNILSVQRGIEKCNGKAILTSDPDILIKADKVILPGVGAFKNAMDALKSKNLDQAIIEISKKGNHILGICLGMQMFLDESEEFGLSSGLGLIPGSVIPVPSIDSAGNKLKIPHIGWNSIKQSKSNQRLDKTILENNNFGDYFYFVHSFMASPNKEEHRLADCFYGGNAVSAIIKKENIVGCQFHPEKSGEVGLKILDKFCVV